MDELGDAMKRAFEIGFTEGWFESQDNFLRYPSDLKRAEVFFKWSRSNEYKALRKAVREATNQEAG